MRILVTFIFSLITGISSSAMARQDIFEQAGSVPHHMHLLGYVNTTLEDIEKFDRDMCTKNGGPGTYDAHKKSWDHLENCILYVRNQVREELGTRNYPSVHHWLTASYEKFCAKVSNLEHCFKNMTDSMKTCLDPEKHGSANIIYNTISSVMQFACKDGAIRLIEFDAARGYTCVDKRVPALLNCANQTIFKYIKTTMPNGAAVGGLGALHLLVPDVNKCTIMQNLKFCAIDVLKTCPEPAPAVLLSSVFNVIEKVTTCDRLIPNVSKSQTGSAGVISASVNVLMMTAVLAISLQFA